MDTKRTAQPPATDAQNMPQAMTTEAILADTDQMLRDFGDDYKRLAQ